MLSAIPTPVAIRILFEKNEPIIFSGIRSLIHEFQLQPETAPKAETTASNTNKTEMAIFAGKIKGLKAIISQQILLKAAATTVIIRLFRIFSTINIEGS